MGFSSLSFCFFPSSLIESFIILGALDLKIVFFPLLAFETAILVDNVRMCRALMLGEEESMSDEAICETFPPFWVAISMVFFIAATIFTLLKLCGDVNALGWWNVFMNVGIAECFAFLICTKWYNPEIHRRPHIRPASSSSATVRYLNWNSGLVVYSEEDYQQSRVCSFQDIGGHVMKVPLIGFQILLFMRLEGTPASARHIPILVLFAPLFLLQGAGFLFAIYRFMEKVIFLLHSDSGAGIYFRISTSVRDYLRFMDPQRLRSTKKKLLGWWSIDESSREEQTRLCYAGTSGGETYEGEEQARLCYVGTSGYNTFSPDAVKKMPKSELAEEIWRLQAALSEQSKVTKFSQEECETSKRKLTTQEEILCTVCFEEQIDTVLLPCRHHILCRRSVVLIILLVQAAPAVISAKCVLSAVYTLRSACAYMVYSLSLSVGKLRDLPVSLLCNPVSLNAKKIDRWCLQFQLVMSPLVLL